MTIISGRRARACVLGAIAASLFIIIGRELETAQFFDEPIQSLVVHLFNELGIAGLVAVTLAVTFERLSGEEFRRLGAEQLAVSTAQFQSLAEEERAQIKKDVFHYVFGHSIPKEITDEIDTQILRSSFVRKRFGLNLTLTPVHVAGSHRYLHISGHLSYDLENLTSDPKVYEFRPSLQRTCAFGPLAQEIGFTKVEITGCGRPIQWDEEALRARRVETPSHVLVRVEADEFPVIPPKSGQRTRVDAHYETFASFDCGPYYLIFSHHTTDVEVRVHMKTTGYAVHIHSTTESNLGDGRWHAPENNDYHWETDRPFLASQGLYLTWAGSTVDRPTGVVQLGNLKLQNPPDGDGAEDALDRDKPPYGEAPVG